MTVLDPPALIVERENEQLDQHTGFPLPVHENQPVMNDAVLPFMKNLLNQSARTPEEQQHQQQIASAQLFIEQYFNEKVADFDSTGKRQTKYEFEALEDRIQTTLGLKIASATVIASLATNNAESVTEQILTSHRLVCIIAGKAQQLREQAFAPPMFRELLGPDVSVSDVFGKKSKEKLKKAKTAKIIKNPKKISVTNPKPVVQPAEASQTIPITSSVQQQAQPQIQILPLPQKFTILIIKPTEITTIIRQVQQFSWSNFCHNSQQSCRTRHLHRTNSPHNSPNRNESGLSKALRQAKKNRKLKILKARVREPNDQYIIIQEKLWKEGIMPQYSIDLVKILIPVRFMARLNQWDKIGGTQTIIRGAQLEWISPAAPLLIQSQQQPHQFRRTLEYDQEYMTQPEKELSSVVVIEMDNVQVYNPTFLVPRQDERTKIDSTRIKLCHDTRHQGRFSSRACLSQPASISGVSVQEHELRIPWPTIRLETKLSTLQQDLSNSYQSNMGEMEVTTQTDDSRDLLLSIKSGLATLSYQTCDNAEEMLLISRQKLPNLINGSNNDSNMNKKPETQTERLDSNVKRELNSIARGGWNASVRLLKKILSELLTILILIKQNKPRQMKDRIPDLILTTDASEDGWGMTLEQNQEQIMDVGQQFSIRRWRAASEILHLVREIFILLDSLNLTIYIEHLPGLQNTAVVALSRFYWIGDYMINPYLRMEVLHQIDFQSTLDAFAHRTNKQLDRYYFPQEERKVFAINAMNIPWRGGRTSITPPIGLIPKNNIETNYRQSCCSANSPQVVLLQVQINATLNTESSNFRPIGISLDSRQVHERRTETRTRNHRVNKDKQKDGEQLYRQLAESTNLSQIAIDTLIANQNIETWRKRRAELTSLAQYIKEKGISVKDLLDSKPDIELVNALFWYKSRSESKLQKRIKNMLMHCEVVVSQFSQMNAVNDSHLIKTFSKGNELADVVQSKHYCHEQLKEKKTHQCMIKFGIIYPRRLMQHHSTISTNLQASLEELASNLCTQVQPSAMLW
ncbi:MAG: hypothetical protein EZS28_005753 [Streblomastix strix]|uniref:Reverse transcriptase RNase H-like domain-containing protein n=1 Tax=Streblomastix strix TaxID=222440 RepID=A0A5J4WUX8_9EUKA|nr:MAG: hypothetical protein EZS28_005753 [Streblomastix strix]